MYLCVSYRQIGFVLSCIYPRLSIYTVKIMLSWHHNFEKWRKRATEKSCYKEDLKVWQGSSSPPYDLNRSSMSLLNFPSDDSAERHIWVHVPSSHSEDPRHSAAPLQAWPRCTHNDYLVHPEDLLILSVVPVNAFFLLSHWSKWMKKEKARLLSELSGYNPKPEADNMIMNVIDYTIAAGCSGYSLSTLSEANIWRTPSLQ